jgi:hypothetical protein
MAKQKLKGATMARKKKPEPQAESIGDFPEITTTCILKQFTAKKNVQEPKLAKFKVSGRQADILLSLVNSGEKIKVTFSAIQGRLPLKE